MIPARSTLSALSAILLDPSSWPGERRDAVQRLFDLLFELAGDTVSEAEMDRDILLPQGIAISPRDAARCILDVARTTGFLRGVEMAVGAARQRHPERPVEMLYAGCGPFAPLALPIADLYRPEELQITLLEIHPAALDSARRVFDRLGLSDRVREFVNVDATHYQAPQGCPWDVCVIEVLQQALRREPQLAVTAQLAPQLAEDGVLIPERITVIASLADLATEFQFLESGQAASRGEGKESRNETSSLSSPGSPRRRIELARLLELDRQSAAGLVQTAIVDGDSSARFLPETLAEIPAPASSGLHTMLRTTIQIANGIILDDYDSGLTVPQILHSIGRVQIGDRLGFRYRLGENPGFVARRLD